MPANQESPFPFFLPDPSFPSQSRFSRIPFSFESAYMVLAIHDFDWLAGRAAGQTVN
jgi:hypothetical protein